MNALATLLGIDLPLLQAVTHPHAVNPAPGLRQIAIEQAWPTLDWQLAS